MSSDIAKILSDRKFRLTKPRQAIFETLKKSDRPLSYQELTTANLGIDKVSVYRTIDLFIRLGVVMSVPHGWKQRYELAAPFRPHHHHLLCSECNVVQGIQSDELEKIIQVIGGRHKFQVTGHTFEITGLCRNCWGVHTSKQ